MLLTVFLREWHLMTTSEKSTVHYQWCGICLASIYHPLPTSYNWCIIAHPCFLLKHSIRFKYGKNPRSLGWPSMTIIFSFQLREALCHKIAEIAQKGLIIISPWVVWDLYYYSNERKWGQIQWCWALSRDYFLHGYPLLKVALVMWYYFPLSCVTEFS